MLDNQNLGYRIIELSCYCRHSNETVTFVENFTKYKHVRICMVEFLSKTDCRGIKIARVNSIRMTKSIKYVLSFLTGRSSR